MVTSYDLALTELESLCSSLKTIGENSIPPANLVKTRETKTAIQRELEEKIRREKSNFRAAKESCVRAEKELNAKRENIVQYVKTYESLEMRLSRATEAYEKKVKREIEKQTLISSLFEFLSSVGLHFDLIKMIEDQPEEFKGLYKIGFSDVDPEDPKKILNVTFEASPQSIKVLEVDAAEAEFKKIEDFINNKFRRVVFPMFISRARKAFLQHYRSANKVEHS